jgi:hypothetical protein
MCGLVLLIVRSKAGEAGVIHFTATSDDLAQASVAPSTRPVKAR